LYCCQSPSVYIVLSAVNLPVFSAVVSLQLSKTLLIVMFPPVVASLLLLVSPAVPVVSCVAVGSVVDVFLQMLFVPDVPAMARVSGVAAFPTTVGC
jgi:hypothetical protein